MEEANCSQVFHSIHLFVHLHQTMQNAVSSEIVILWYFLSCLVIWKMLNAVSDAQSKTNYKNRITTNVCVCVYQRDRGKERDGKNCCVNSNN